MGVESSGTDRPRLMVSAFSLAEKIAPREAPSGDVKRDWLDVNSYFINGEQISSLSFVDSINPDGSSLLSAQEVGLFVALCLFMLARFLPLNMIISSLEFDKGLEERRTPCSCK